METREIYIEDGTLWEDINENHRRNLGDSIWVSPFLFGWALVLAYFGEYIDFWVLDFRDIRKEDRKRLKDLVNKRKW